ncbi:MAG: ParA family protein [Treponema sp.]|nr:ParA family protein [Treponema sp.]MCL2237466.1 ParA family protein [Treponema sp.]
MGSIFVFVNQKGGVGKTTSAINIGAYLADAGKSVLLIDFDAQANLSSGIGANPPKPGIYELLCDEATSEQATRKTSVKKLEVIPADTDLSGAAVEMIEHQKEKFFFLKKAIDPLKEKYEYILIDCPPSLGQLTMNGLVAADAVLIPMQCEYFAMEGLKQLLITVKDVQKIYNPKLRIGGVFFTMYDQRTRLANDVIKLVSAHYKDMVFNTIIPRNTRLSEAPSEGMPISLYDPQCPGARAYQALAQEMLRREKAGGK